MELILVLIPKKQGDFRGDVELFYAWCFFIKMMEYPLVLFGQTSCWDGENTTRPAKGVLAWGWGTERVWGIRPVISVGFNLSPFVG